MDSDQAARLCPKCGAIVTSGNENCGVCGADLWETKEESVKVAVQEEERADGAAADQLRRNERKNARRVGMVWVGVYTGTALLILSGLTLLIYSPSFAPFQTGLVLLIIGLMILLVVIGPGPRWRSRGWPRAQAESENRLVILNRIKFQLGDCLEIYGYLRSALG